MARAGLSRARLAQVAAELADEVGLEAVTASAVARRVGVAPASVYSHVESTHDLRTQVTLLALAEMADRGDEALAGRSGKDALVALGGVYRTYAREHPGRYAAARARLDHDTAVASAGPRHAHLARAVLRGYDLIGPEQTHAVRLLGSVFHGYASLELGGGFDHSDPSPEVTWRRVLDALDALLRRWPDPDRLDPDPLDPDQEERHP